LIVPARQFEIGRLLCSVDNGKIMMSAGVSRLQLNRLAQRGFRWNSLSFLAQSYSEIILCLGIARVDLGRPAQVIKRFVKLILAKLEHAHQGQAEGVFRVRGNGALDMLFRLL